MRAFGERSDGREAVAVAPFNKALQLPPNSALRSTRGAALAAVASAAALAVSAVWCS